jgi:hypothetical protein
MPRIRRFFQRAQTERPTYRWSRDDCAGGDSATQDLVEDLASRIMEYRCRGQPGRFTAWTGRRNGGPPHNDTVRRALEIVIGTAVGLPQDAKSRDHIEAFVAEHLWYFLTLEADNEESLVRVVGPSVEVTEIGGDGLTVYEATSGDLAFFLWEVKKYAGNGSATPTVTSACRQLDTEALRYLHKFSLLGQEEAEERVSQLYGRLLDEWIEATVAAGAAVAIGTSRAAITNRSFGALPRIFPRLAAPPRLQGCAAAVDDFPAFADVVKEEMWKGL